MSLAAAFQGIERGIGLGMQYYDTIEGRARQKRLDALQVDRYNRQDMEADREFDYRQSRDRVADDQWEQNFSLETDKHTLAKDRHKTDVAYQQGTLANAAEANNLRRTIFNDQVSERERLEQRQTDHHIMQTTLIGGDGNYITDPKALAERLNSNPMAMQAMLRRAVDEKWMTADRANNYTGMKAVVIGDSIGFLVAGRDGEGEVIRPGGGPITEGGTAHPDDPALVVKPQQLGLMFGGDGYRNMMRADSVLSQESENFALERNEKSEAALASAQRMVEDTERNIADTEAKLAALQKEREDNQFKMVEKGGQRSISGGTGVLGIRAGDITRTREQVQSGPSKQEQALLDNLDKLKSQRQRTLSQIENIPVNTAQEISIFDRNQDMKRGTYGEQYPAVKGAQAKSLSEATQKAVKDFDSIAGKYIKAAAGTRNKKTGKMEHGLSELELQTAVQLLPPETRAQIAQGGTARAVFANALRVASDTGYRGNLQHLIEADAIAGVGMEKFSDIASSPQLAGFSSKMRGDIALEGARRWAENPKRDIEAILGEILSGL